MHPRIRNQACVLTGILGAFLISSSTDAQITQVLDSAGDGFGNMLNTPNDLAVDDNGNLYVSSNYTALVFKVSQSGTVTPVIDYRGDGNGNNLLNPSGVAVDSAGNVFVTGSNIGNVFKITPNGVITVIMDETAGGVGAGLVAPNAPTVDNAGNLYVAGAASDNVYRITPGGVITEILTSAGDGLGNTIDHPTGIDVDQAGNVYVVGHKSANAFKITPSGSITEIFDRSEEPGTIAYNNPRGIVVDSTGNVYVSGDFVFTEVAVYKIDPEGNVTAIFYIQGDGKGNQCYQPFDIAAGPSDSVLVACHSFGGSGRAFLIRSNGNISTILNEKGDNAGNEFGSSQCIVSNGAGKIYAGGGTTDNIFEINLKRGACPMRNGNGQNPQGLTCVSAPVIGTDFQLSVDQTASLGGSTIATLVVIGFGGPTSGIFTGAGELLVLDPMSFLFTVDGTYTGTVPNQSYFLGHQVFTQGLRIETNGRVWLNALDLTIGF